MEVSWFGAGCSWMGDKGGGGVYEREGGKTHGSKIGRKGGRRRAFRDALCRFDPRQALAADGEGEGGQRPGDKAGQKVAGGGLTEWTMRARRKRVRR
jgi:hypothetical protein